MRVIGRVVDFGDGNLGASVSFNCQSGHGVARALDGHALCEQNGHMIAVWVLRRPGGSWLAASPMSPDCEVGHGVQRHRPAQPPPHCCGVQRGRGPKGHRVQAPCVDIVEGGVSERRRVESRGGYSRSKSQRMFMEERIMTPFANRVRLVLTPLANGVQDF